MAASLPFLWQVFWSVYSAGAFLIPYFIMLFLCGIPLLLMELAIGQYMRYGPIGSMARVAPVFKGKVHSVAGSMMKLMALLGPLTGVGVATVVITFILTTYYNVIIAWALYYLFSSFKAVLPWSNCQNLWNTKDCFDQSEGVNGSLNTVLTSLNQTANFTTSDFLRPVHGGNSPSQEFYE